MEGKVCIVTGATSGIGLETAKALAQKGATVVLVGRNQEKGLDIVNCIKEATGNPAVEFMQADLSAQDQIRQLAQSFKERFSRLDVLVNNVGGYFLNRQMSVDGIELTFALDYLGIFLLTHLLLDMLVESAPARVVNVTSAMYKNGKIHFDNLSLEGEYLFGVAAYGQSKLALMLFTAELARRLEDKRVTVNTLHPGLVGTRIWEKGGCLLRWLGILLRPVIKLTTITPAEGAETSIYLASSPEVAEVTGKYFENKKIVGEARVGHSEETIQRLWKISAEMANLSASE